MILVKALYQLPTSNLFWCHMSFSHVTTNYCVTCGTFLQDNNWFGQKRYTSYYGSLIKSPHSVKYSPLHHHQSHIRDLQFARSAINVGLRPTSFLLARDWFIDLFDFLFQFKNLITKFNITLIFTKFTEELQMVSFVLAESIYNVLLVQLLSGRKDWACSVARRTDML